MFCFTLALNCVVLRHTFGVSLVVEVSWAMGGVGVMWCGVVEWGGGGVNWQACVWGVCVGDGGGGK